MLDGYNSQAEAAKWDSMSMVDFLILNSDGETPELMTAFDMEVPHANPNMKGKNSVGWGKHHQTPAL